MVKRWFALLVIVVLMTGLFPAPSADAAYGDGCFAEANRERYNRPDGAITSDGRYIEYDYSLLPSPKDMIYVCVNNQFLKTDVPAEIEKGATLIPMRALLEKLKADFSWDNKNQTITASLRGKTIRLQVDNKTAVVNGQKVNLETPPRLKNGRVLVPVRFVTEQLDCQVRWLPNNNIIKIFTHPEVKVSFTNAKSIHSDDYSYGNYFSHSSRYLLENDKSIFLLEDVGDAELRIQRFTTSFVKKEEFKLKGELKDFAGAHLGEDGFYYILYTQDNPEESDSKTVYRLVKYDKAWKKTAYLDIKDVHVTHPVDASNLTMDSHNGKLVIYTARERYRSSDGLNHQSNIMFHIDMDKMTLLYKGGEWPHNHVSHSFATYVRFDGERIVYADHGDAYPRSIVLQAEDNGKITQTIELLKFPGEIGDNYTGAHLGGLEVSDKNYLLTGSSVSLTEKYGSSRTKNLFLGVIPKTAKSDEDAKLIWITDHAVNSGNAIVETHLVKLSDNKFALLWTESKSGNSLFYAVVDGAGKLLKKPAKLEGIPSPGNIAPLVRGNSIIWTYYTLYHESSHFDVPEGTEFYSLRID